jgi:hypothetical protein
MPGLKKGCWKRMFAAGLKLNFYIAQVNAGIICIVGTVPELKGIVTGARWDFTIITGFAVGHF